VNCGDPNASHGSTEKLHEPTHEEGKMDAVFMANFTCILTASTLFRQELHVWVAWATKPRAAWLGCQKQPPTNHRIPNFILPLASFWKHQSIISLNKAYQSVQQTCLQAWRWERE